MTGLRSLFDKAPRPASALGLLLGFLLQSTYSMLVLKLGHVPLLGFALLAVAPIGLAIGALITGHLAKTQTPARERLLANMALVSMLASLALSLTSLHLLFRYTAWLPPIVDMMQQGAQVLLVAPLIATLFILPGSILAGLAIPHAIALESPIARPIMRSALGAITAVLIGWIAPAISLYALPVVIVVLSILSRQAKVEAEPEAHEPRSKRRKHESPPRKISPAWPALVLLISAFATGLVSGAGLRVMRILYGSDATSTAALILAALLCFAAGILGGAKVGRKKSALSFAGWALVASTLFLAYPFVVMNWPEWIASLEQSIFSLYLPLLLATKFWLLCFYFIIPAGGLGLALGASAETFVQKSSFPRPAAGSLALAAWLIPFGIALYLSMSVFIPFFALTSPLKVLLWAAALSGLSALIALHAYARQERLDLSPAIIAAMLIVGPIIIGSSMLRAWQPLNLIDGGRFLEKTTSQPRLVSYFEAADASLVVTQEQDSREVSVWRDGRRVMSSEDADDISRSLLGLYPMLLNPAANRACVIGTGTGETLEAITAFPQMRFVHVFEPHASMVHAAVSFVETSAQASKRPGVYVRREDVRTNFAAENFNYDLIVWGPDDLSSPESRGLFTRDFLRECKEHLTERGMVAFCLRAEDCRSEDFQRIAFTVMKAFPHVLVFEGAYGDFIFVASRQPLNLSLNRTLAALKERSIAEAVAPLQAHQRPSTLTAGFICRGEALQAVIKADEYADSDAARLITFTEINEVDSIEIMRTMLSAQTDPFRDLVQPQGIDEARLKTLRQETAAMIQSRALRYELVKAVQNGRVPQSMEYGRAMLRAASGDPRAKLYFVKMMEHLKQRRREMGDVQGAESLEKSLKMLMPATAPTKAPAGDAAESFLQLGREALKKQDAAEAEKQFRAAFTANPASEEARYQLGVLLLATDRAPEALELLLPLAKRKDLPAEGHMAIASALGASGRTKEALTALETALQAGFNNRRVLENSPYLKDIRRTPEYGELMNKYFKDKAK